MFLSCRYSTEPGDIDIPIGCVVRAQPGSFPRDSMDIEPLLQLDDVIQLSDHEELVSHIFDMMPTSGERKLQVCSLFKTDEPKQVICRPSIDRIQGCGD